MTAVLLSVGGGKAADRLWKIYEDAVDDVWKPLMAGCAALGIELEVNVSLPFAFDDVFGTTERPQ